MYLRYREYYSMNTLTHFPTHFLSFSSIAFLHCWVWILTSFENLWAFCDCSLESYRQWLREENIQANVSTYH